MGQLDRRDRYRLISAYNDMYKLYNVFTAKKYFILIKMPVCDMAMDLSWIIKKRPI